MYKTGDLVRWQADGKIEFLGWTHHQVKIRGFRIELGEIESVLAGHPEIREAVVVAREDVPGDMRLVAYLIPKAAEPPKVSELRSLLQAKLPEYMVPSAFVTLNALPLTPNGKVDRKALPKPDFQPSADKFALPSTPTEIALARIWSDVLGLKQIGLHDNFFEIGGHSLQAIRLSAAIHRCFGKPIPVGSIFTAPTILQFSKLLDENANRAASALSDGLRGNGTGAPLFYIPGLPGYGFLPRDVARHLNGSCRYYDGLQYPGLHNQEPMSGSVEEIAAHLIPQIQRIWPHGPYYLMGWSFGGTMAFEVARQLEARGEKVQLVLLLDSRCPGSGRRKRSVAETVGLFRCHLSTLNGPRRAAFFRDLVINKLRFMLSSIKRNFETKRKDDTTPLMEATRQAAAKYQPGCYGGRVVLFQAEDWNFDPGFRYAPDLTFGWGKWVRGGLEIIPVPGDHKSMLDEPAVSKVAERMRDFLKQDADEQTTTWSRAGSQ
jgi:thioesterase domain-containing protein